MRETKAQQLTVLPSLARRLLLGLAASTFWLSALAQGPAPVPGKGVAAGGAPPAVAACAACHGARGEGTASFPRLAGTGQAYLQAQLTAFASGERKSPVMQPIAQGLSPAQREAVTRYFSQLPALVPAPQANRADPADRGAWLATRGRWSDEVPACNQCHGPGGVGVGPSFPPLAGLPAAYVTQQLQGFKQGTRPPGPLDLMKSIAAKLSEEDMQALGNYYAGLGSTKTTAATTAAPNGSASATKPKGMQ